MFSFVCSLLFYLFIYCSSFDIINTVQWERLGNPAGIYKVIQGRIKVEYLQGIYFKYTTTSL